MDNYARYKVLHAEVLLDRSLSLESPPYQADNDLDTLWDSLTSEEKEDLRIWLLEQQRI